MRSFSRPSQTRFCWSANRAGQPRDLIAEAFKVLRPEAHPIAGIVLNKADGSRIPGYAYSGYNYRSVGKHSATLET